MRKLLMCLLLAAGSVFSADSLQVLFFGHSLMYSTGVGRQLEFKQWAADKGLPMWLRMQNAAAGHYCQNIQQAWNGTSNKDTVAKYEWDFVFYDKGDAAGMANDTFYKYHGLFIDTIKKCGAVPIIYDTWHHDVEPMVLEAARRFDGNVAPVWQAYQWCLARYPDIHYKIDWAHAAEPLGYLAGCVCWATAFAEKPFGFNKVYAKLSVEEAHLMQQAAWNACTHPTYLPFMPWTTTPSLVKSVALTKSPDTLEQYRTRQLLVRTVFMNDSVEAASKWAIFQSLTPDIVTVSHSGIATGKKLGTGRVVAIREQRSDTLSLIVKPTSLVLDSVRIVPHVLTSYLSGGYQFAANAYFRDGAAPLTMDVTSNVTWISGDTSIFRVPNGYIQRVTAKGGQVFVAIELNGKKDTVRFTMVPEFRYLTRINFQTTDTIYNQNWKADNGDTYTDALGYGWMGVEGFYKRTNDQAIQYFDSNFLRHSFVTPQASGGVNTWGQYKLKAPDGDYIVKIAVGSYYQYTVNSVVVFENRNTLDTTLRTYTDTLVNFTPTSVKKQHVIKDTIRVFGEDGIKLRIFGPIDYMVVCTQEGVDIDSVALDGDQVIKSTGLTSPGAPGSSLKISAYPNPFNPAVRISVSSGVVRGACAVSVYDMTGKLVKNLGTVSGRRDVQWDGTDIAGRSVGSGLYVFRILDGKITREIRATLMK